MLKSLIALTIIPIIGFMISIGVLNSLAEDISISELVENVTYNCEIDYQSVCSSFDNIILLKNASIYSGLASFFIVFSYFLIARISGSNRNLISKLFPPLIPIVLCAISVQVLTQGAIFTFGAYLGESFLIGRVHYILIGAIGLGAGIGALQIIGSIFSLSKKLVHIQQGHLLLAEEHPKIWDFVKNIANEIGSTPPNNIIVGLEPTFYATAADVVGCGDTKLKGETLYLSLPLMRLFNRSELMAVVGHELGHFSAKDTAFSTKFAPVYRGLGNSIKALSGANEGALSIAKLPALLVLASMYESFEKNVASISREREFEADKVGVSVSSGKDLANALSKVILFSPLWNNVRIDNIKRLNAGKISENLSLIFKDKSAYNLSKQLLDEKKENILASSVSHPTDTHPSLMERLKNVGFNSEEISIENILKQGDSCSDLVDNIEQIEKDLTLLEHRIMVESGYAVVPEDSGETDTLANALYIMAAGMVGIDGKLEQEEIAAAEHIGAQLIDTFDPTDFREYVKNLDVIPNILEVAKQLSSLDEDAKKIIYSYLEDIANADGDLALEELNVLTELKKIWNFN
jgi:Zn-dependent protease with chaperone function/uncharacterized tellurite resistance protein B-like protein